MQRRPARSPTAPASPTPRCTGSSPTATRSSTDSSRGRAPHGDRRPGRDGETPWNIASVWDLVNAELNLHINYYREHPSSARLWMGGRSSTAVARQVHARMRTLAQRIYAKLIEAKLIGADIDPRAVLVAVEIADRVLELAYRDRQDFDEAIL